MPGDGCATDPPTLEYFTNSDGSFKHMQPMAPIAPVTRNTWVGGLAVIDKGQPTESMYCHYLKPSTGGGGPDADEMVGLARWNDTASHFQAVSV